MSLLYSLLMSVADGSVVWIFLSILIGGYLIYLHLHYAGTPPGPWGLLPPGPWSKYPPVFGYLLFFSKKPYEDFIKLRKKYGSVFTINIGSRYVLVLNDYEDIQTAYAKQGDNFAGKPLEGIAREMGDFNSVFVTDGRLAKLQRSFLLSSMRDFDYGKKVMEERIQEEAELTINEFMKSNEKPMEVIELLDRAVANIIACLLFGQRFHYSHEAVVKSLNSISQMVSVQSHFTILDAFPQLQSIIPLSLFGVDKVKMIKKQVYEFVDEQIKKHKETFDANNIRDVIDTYLLKLEQIKKSGQLSTDNVFTDDYLRANALVLFLAGADTSASTLGWAVKLLAVYPDIQREIQKEIDDTIGRERLPSMGDKTKMPFTEATILEIDRFISLVPIIMYHRVTEDTVLKGYKIWKNTLVLANLWNVHHNTDTWKDPHKFNPRRFLDSDGKVSKLREYILPFSTGKRHCLGESLAKMESFLFLICFLQKLTFSPANNDTDFDTINEIPVRKLKSCVISIKLRH